MKNKNRAGETPANVAAQATLSNALDAGRPNLLGIFGSEQDLRALVRLPGGRMIKVGPGQRVPGAGHIVGIDATGIMVLTNGRTQRIDLPGG